jgi:hypothetical protein
MVNQRFEAIERRFIDLEKNWDARYNNLQHNMDLRFADMNQRLDRLEGTLKRGFGLFAPVIIGILAILVKQFLGA